MGTTGLIARDIPSTSIGWNTDLDGYGARQRLSEAQNGGTIEARSTGAVPGRRMEEDKDVA